MITCIRTELRSGIIETKESTLHFPNDYYLYTVFLFSFVLLLDRIWKVKTDQSSAVVQIRSEKRSGSEAAGVAAIWSICDRRKDWEMSEIGRRALRCCRVMLEDVVVKL